MPEPHGSACLGQEILAEDYRGRAVTFRAELRTEDVSHRACLFLQVQTEQPERAVYDYQSAFLTGSHDWASYEITAQVPDRAVLIQFGITLDGPGQVALRHADLISRLGALVFLDGPRVPVEIVVVSCRPATVNPPGQMTGRPFTWRVTLPP